MFMIKTDRLAQCVGVFLALLGPLLWARSERDRPLDRWVSMLAVGGVLVVAFLRVGLVAGADGHLLSAPIDGASDQIDYVAMAYSFSEHSVIGTTAGPELAQPVLDLAAERGRTGNLLERCGERGRSAAHRQRDPLDLQVLLIAT